MSACRYSAIFTIAACLVIVTAVPGRATEAGGILFQDTTWSESESPYVVTSDVFVPEGITLTIEPGVKVAFDRDRSFFVDGALIARGTEEKPITFTGNGSTSGDFWGYLLFSDTSADATFDEQGQYTGGCILEHVIVQHAGSNVDSAVKMNNAGLYLKDCTIQDNGGSGVHATGSTAVLDGCVVSGNSRIYGDGGGIYVTGSSQVTLQNSTISDNSARYGGGIYVMGSSQVTLQNCTISDNSAGHGGGMQVSSSQVTLQNSTVSDNSATYDGGGMYVSSGQVTLQNSTVSDNSAGRKGHGGGMYVIESSQVTLQNSTVSTNSAGYNGGGVYVSSSQVTISDSLFTDNSANIGSASYLVGSTLRLYRNTFTGNRATGSRGAVLYVSAEQGSVIGGAEEDANFFVQNPSDAVRLDGEVLFNYNVISENSGFGLICGNSSGSDPIDATNNYWGTTIEGVIKALIWDGLDDNTLGRVDYKPYLTAPPGTPGVDIPDAQLEAAIRDALDKQTGGLSPSDLIGLTELDASARGISNLKGLEYCGNLETLLLYSNQITDLSPLAGLGSLKTLNLAGNQVKDVSPLSNLTELTLLNLGGNKIQDVSPLSGLSKLETLNLGGNGLADIAPLKQLTSLNQLYLGGNQLSDLQALVENTGLAEGDRLDVRGNPLSADAIATQIPTLQGRGVDVMFEQVTPGDVNGDGSVTAADAVLVLQHLVGLIRLDAVQIQTGDLSKDGTLSACDAALILRQVSGPSQSAWAR